MQVDLRNRDVKREPENRQPGTGLESEKPVIDFAGVCTFTWVIVRRRDGVPSSAGNSARSGR